MCAQTLTIRGNAIREEELMRLTKFSDYSLKVLLFAAAAPGRSLTIEETALAYGISRAHLKKVVLMLGRHGFLMAVRGRSGGYSLARRPEDINLGDVLRVTEPDFALMECFAADNHCKITGQCRMPTVLNRALAAFLAVFDSYTLHDMMIDPSVFEGLAGKPLVIQPVLGPKLVSREGEASE